MPTRATTRATLRQLLAIGLPLALFSAPLAHAEPENDQRAYFTANGLLNRGLNDLAAQEYRRFLESNPDHEKAALARYGLGVALYRLGDHADALAQLDQVAPVESFEYAAETQLLRGHCLLALNDPGAAAQAFARVVQTNAGHTSAPDAAVLLVESLNRAGRYAEAIEAAAEVERRYPDAPMRDRADLFRGLSLLATNKPADAAERFDAIINRSPQGELMLNATLLLAQSRHRLDDLARAERGYQRVIESGDAALAPEAMVGLGQLDRQRGRHKEAAETLDRVLERFPNSPMAARATLERARVRLDVGELDLAADAFSSLADEGPEDLRDDATYWRAKVDLRRGDPAGAAARLVAAAERYPKSELRPEMVYDRAIALSRAGEREQAAGVLREFMQAYPSHRLAPDALHAAASTAHSRALYDESLALCALFEASFAATPLAADITMLRAENEYMRANYPAAEAAYRALLDTTPREDLRRRASYRLGMALSRQNRFDDAEPLLLAAADLAEGDHSYARALVALGDAYFEREQWDRAAQMFARVVAVNADSTPVDDALLKLGLSQERRGEYEPAIETFTRLLVDRPQSSARVHAEFELAQSLIALERWSEAIPHLEVVLQSEDNERFAPHAMHHMGTIARARADHAAAAEWFRRASEAGGDDLAARSVYDQGESLLVAGDAGAAVDRFTEFLEAHPEHELAARARARRAVALSRADRFEEALAEIEALTPALDSLPARVRHAALYEKAWSLRELGRADEAAGAYRDLLARDVDASLRAYALLDLGGIDLDAQRWDAASESLSQLDQLLASDGALGDAQLRAQGAYRLGAASLRLGDDERAVALLDTFHERFPGSDLIPAASVIAGEALANTGRHERAAAHFGRVVNEHESDAQAPTAMLRLGDQMVALQRWDDAERSFGLFLERHPGDERWFQAQFGVGWSREQRAEHEPAIEAYRNVVDQHEGPTAARAQFQIGECLFAMGQLDSAVTELLRVDILYAYDEWSAASLYEAGRCLEQLERPNKAREQYQQVVDRFPNEKWAELARARLEELKTAAPPGHAGP